jgi:hypothetical protein
VEGQAVAFGVDEPGHEAVLADGGLGQDDLAAGGFDAGEWRGEIGAAVEIQERSVGAGVVASDLLT